MTHLVAPTREPDAIVQPATMFQLAIQLLAFGVVLPALILAVIAAIPNVGGN